MSRAILSTEVRSEQDVVAVRQKARELARLVGFDSQDQVRIATAVSELARNAFRYARGGRVEFALLSEPSPALEIHVWDQGTGIGNLSEVLEGRYRSETGMGLGLIGTRRLMDRFEIDSSPGSGTRVRISKFLPPGAPALTGAQLGSIGETLARNGSGAPLDELERQNAELLRALNELHQRQVELRNLNQELEETNRGVVALYAELDEKAEALRKANSVKTRFLSNITHEFRTPLSAILSLTQLLIEGSDGPLNAEQGRQVRLVRKSVEHLKEMVNDLLDLAKVEAGRISVKPAPVELQELFQTLKTLFKTMTPAGVELVLEDAGRVPTLVVDEGKLTQILRNLISNALKYTEQGTVRVRAALLGERVEIQVEDSGIGIDSKDLDSIFEEFVQIESSLQRKHKGTGLGLPLSRRLAELMGGSLKVKSRIGQGSRFTLELPISYKGAHEGVWVDEPRAPVPSSAHRRRMLLIDDQDDERYFLSSVLSSRFSSDVIEARSGREGLSRALEMRPDWIFLDLDMPDMTGFEVLDALGERPETRDIPVVVHSGMTLQAGASERLRRARAILCKGDSEERLIHRLTELL